MNEIKEKAIKLLDQYLEQTMAIKTMYAKILDPKWEPRYDSETFAWKDPNGVKDEDERNIVESANNMYLITSTAIESVGLIMLELFDNDPTIKELFKKHNVYIL